MTLLDLAPMTLLALAVIAFAAGLVRGFTGFALSAVGMAAGALLLPPVELIPVLWCLELSASTLMLRGGWKDADRGVAVGLAVGSAVGLPIGLWLTLRMDPDLSRLVALCIVVALASSQLLRLRLGVLASRGGLYAAGLVAGCVTGLAGVGGMVVALYVLAQSAPARQMRASLVLYLAIGSVASGAIHVAVGTLDQVALVRGIVLSVPCLIGVILGMRLFVPRWERWYKPACLCLLIALAVGGILRLVVG